METFVQPHSKKDHDISQQGHDVHKAERDGKPYVEIFQARDARQEKRQRIGVGLVGAWHGTGGTSQIFVPDFNSLQHSDGKVGILLPSGWS